MTDDITPHTRRLFFALWPDEPVRDALTQIQARIGGRRMRRENLHLTLAFLGEQPAGSVDMLAGLLSALSAGEMPLVLDRIGYFPRQRIAWAGQHEAPCELIELHRRLGEALRLAGVAYDARSSFIPHVTLARNAEVPEDMPFAPISWHARQIVLVQSTTRSEGVVYDVLASA